MKKRALISVFDKTGILEFAKFLKGKNIEIDISPKRFFGNKVEIIKNKDSIMMTPSGKIKVEGFQLVFDRGNDINDKRLLEYRKITLE